MNKYILLKVINYAPDYDHYKTAQATIVQNARGPGFQESDIYNAVVS